MMKPLLLLLCLLVSASGRAQAGLPKDLIRSVPESISGNVHASEAEKVYLHFDNTAYFKGDKIWFKAYVVTADRNLPKVLSNVLYIDLLTPEGVVAETRKYKIREGVCNGDFTLTDSLQSGFYEIRAYTRFMLNEGKDAVFSRVFPVYDKPVKPGSFEKPQMRVLPNSKRLPSVRPEMQVSSKPTMSFYPEGGHLVEGLTTRVAFELLGEGGRSLAANGYVFSEKNDTLAEWTTGHSGRGQFLITPVNGVCEACCFIDKKVYRFKLPPAEKEGVAMTVDRDSDRYSVLFQKTPGIQPGILGLTVTSRGHLFASDQISLDEKGVYMLKLPFNRLPSGVAQFTLFDSRGAILAQRCVFTNHHNALKLVLESDSGQALPCSPIRLDFKTESSTGSPVKTDFSLSVRDASNSPYNRYAETLYSNLLLSSELKGYIEDPGYYFEKDDEIHQMALDVLLMIQGWNRFGWNFLAGIDAHGFKYEIEDQLYIDGNVRSVVRKKPLKDIDLLMIQMMDSTSQSGRSITDDKGRFLLELSDFYGKSTVLLQTTQKGKKKNTIIQLNRFLRPETRAYMPAERVVPVNDTSFIRLDPVQHSQVSERPSAKDENALTMDKKVHVLKEVRIKGNRKIQRYEEAIRNSTIIYDVEKTMDELIDQSEDEPSGIQQYLSVMNPYFNYGNADLYKGRKVFYVLDGRYLEEGSDDELFKSLTPAMLQLVTIAESSQLAMTYAPKDVGLAMGKEGVVIFLYTNPGMKDRTSPNGMRRTKFYGYSRSSEFYHPNYKNFSLPDEKDYRRTLYWNPSVKTDEQGKATVRFWNNFRAQGFVISAETVSESGAPGSLLQQIQPK